VSYPTSHNLLREKVRDAIRHPETTMKEYFGEDYVERIADAFDIKGPMSPSQKTRIAAALAVIIFAEIPDQLLAPHLQRYPMEAGRIEVS
jgi:UDP-N-acetylmuramoylalanine-D-glutamate ligase